MIEVEEEMKVPEHIGIIMDGNRRWARRKKLPIQLGHREGAKTLKKIIKYIQKAKLPIRYLTVYAFSTENWHRSQEEVTHLMTLFLEYLDELIKDNEGLCLKVLGDKQAFSKKLQDKIQEVEQKTKGHTELILNVCLNYSGRCDILQAVKKMAHEVEQKQINAEDITKELIEDHLYTRGIPDPDMVVRTSGEYRTSDFLSWQIAYSELYFIEKYWPDFKEKDLDRVILEYTKRSRRYGK